VSAQRSRPLEVVVVHGSLTAARFPIAVGHYQGMPLSGAEGAVNDCLGGLLSERLLVGAYAEQEGTAVPIMGARGCAPPGALVLGLGTPGEVSASKVTRAMTEAVLRHALDVAGAGSARRNIGLSTVLVGANPLDGIPVAKSVAALVEGVVAALQVLSLSERLRSQVHVSTLELVELYGSRATAALDAVRSLDVPSVSRGVVELRLPKRVTKGRGGISGGLPSDYAKDNWLRLDIRKIDVRPAEPGYETFELTSAARRARADRIVQRIETATVDGLVADAVTRPAPDPQVANTLYELLLPSELKQDVQDADNLLLLLEPATARYPWEALAIRGEAGDPTPLASRAGVLRQFADPETRDARFRFRAAAGRYALVIGNPPTEVAPPLPGAAAEAKRVEEILTGSKVFEVCPLIWGGEGAGAAEPPAGDAEPWEAVLNALFRHEYRIVHVAAHGVFDPQHPARSGLLIGPDRFLTAQTVGQLDAVPQLVFLNCCYSGGIEDAGSAHDGRRRVHLLAASVARELMRIGVRAVVAAGWAVNDQGALAFAETFYEQMVTEAESFGVAVAAAREQTKLRTLPGTMTWAAYQCYGDPEFRLRVSGA
jgi:CHAT domain-containing protein